MDYSNMTPEELNAEFNRTRPSVKFDQGIGLIGAIAKLIVLGCVLVLGIKIFLAIM